MLHGLLLLPRRFILRTGKRRLGLFARFLLIQGLVDRAAELLLLRLFLLLVFRRLGLALADIGRILFLVAGLRVGILGLFALLLL